jgi:hypothetical protein
MLKCCANAKMLTEKIVVIATNLQPEIKGQGQISGLGSAD